MVPWKISILVDIRWYTLKTCFFPSFWPGLLMPALPASSSMQVACYSCWICVHSCHLLTRWCFIFRVFLVCNWCIVAASLFVFTETVYYCFGGRRQAFAPIGTLWMSSFWGEVIGRELSIPRHWPMKSGPTSYCWSELRVMALHCGFLLVMWTDNEMSLGRAGSPNLKCLS